MGLGNRDNNRIILFAFLVTLTLSFLGQVQSECEAPKKTVTFDWASSKDGKDGGYFIPLAMRNDTNVVKEMLDGSSLNPDQDLKKICIRLRYAKEGKEVSFSGYNNATSDFKCNRIGDSYDCQHQNGKEEFNHKMYVTLTDKKSFAFVIRCWKNGLRGWSVLSTRKELHEDSQFHILDHAKSQGFETAHALPLSYKLCTR